MRAWCGVVVLGFLLSLFAGCEGVTTGTEVVRLPLQTEANSSFAPVKLPLDTAMNPLSINFRADFTQNPEDFGEHNTYRAQLSKDGNVVATKTFNVNHPQTQKPQGDSGNNAPPPTSTVHTLFITDIAAGGEYELTITALKKAITLNGPTVDVRRNVQRPPETTARAYTVKRVDEFPPGMQKGNPASDKK
jgi:hypothetical protein